MDYSAAAGERHDKSAHEINRVIGRNNAQVARAGPERKNRGHGSALFQIIFVGQHATLRPASRSRRIHDARIVFPRTSPEFRRVRDAIFFPAQRTPEVGVRRRFGNQNRAQLVFAKVFRLHHGAPVRIFYEQHLRCRMCQQLQMLVGGKFVIERHKHASGKENSVGGDQPLGLIGHDDCGALPGREARIFESRSHRLSGFAKLSVGHPRTFALAVSLNQADLIRPTLKRVAQGCA